MSEVQIVLMAFVVVFAARLVLAPFWLYQERDELVATTQALLAERKSGQALLNTLTAHYGEGSALLARCLGGELLPFSELSTWSDKVHATLETHMSFSHRQEFALIMSNTFPQGFTYSDQRMANNVGFLHSRLAKLLESTREVRKF